MKVSYDDQQGEVQAGVDEAGRGCLMGPVVAAAVVWDPSVDPSGITDSKALSKKRRNELREYIIEHAASFHVAMVDEATIDEINILQATMTCMHYALDGIVIPIDRILVDGTCFRSWEQVPHHCITKGDSKYVSIAAASILAKTFRDDYMEQLCVQEPSLSEYGIQKNMGYGTKQHIDAIRKYGTTRHHRKSFHVKELGDSNDCSPCDE